MFAFAILFGVGSTGTVRSLGAQTPRASVARENARNDEIRRELRALGIQTFDDDITMVDFDIPNIAGGRSQLSDFENQFVFLNFWASWCGPCRAEMPSMERLQAELEGLPFSIVAVNVQEREDVVRRYLDESGFTFPVVLDRTGRVAAEYGVRGIPTSFFISPDGTVLGMLVGTREWDGAGVLGAMTRIARLNTES